MKNKQKNQLKTISILLTVFIMVFNLIPTISPTFEARVVTKKVEPKENNLLKFTRLTSKTLSDASAKIPKATKAKNPEQSYIEVSAVISHYTASADECGNDKGITASRKKVSRGMVAAPRNVPFGTNVEINGKRYVVEDRGGKNTITVKNGVYHFDIYVPTKKEAIKLGRYKTTVKIYKKGE